MFLSNHKDIANEIPELESMYMMAEADRLRFAECSGLAYVGYPLFDWMFHGRSDLEHSQAIWSLRILLIISCLR